MMNGFYSRGEAMPVAAKGSEKLALKVDRLNAVAFARALKRLLAREGKTRRHRHG